MIGHDESEVLDVEPAAYFVRVTILLGVPPDFGTHSFARRAYGRRQASQRLDVYGFFSLHPEDGRIYALFHASSGHNEK